jgi:hypothetical protein
MDRQSPFRRMAVRVGAWNAFVSRPLSSGSSRGLVIAGLVVISAAALIGRSRSAILVADFGALTLYSILDPLLVASRPGSWWRLAMLSLGGWMVLFMVGAAASQKMGSDAEVFLFPFMVFPVTLILGGLVRLVRRALRRVPPEGQAP